MSQKWYQVRGSEGAEYRYTPPQGKGRAYGYLNAAYYNMKGVVSLVYNYHTEDVKEEDLNYVRKSIADYFRQYGKRRVFVELGKQRQVQVQVYFLQEDIPSLDQINYWFAVIKNKIHLL